ncbi:MAG: endonuclease IV [Ruminococcaceae bacterium]|nr:endonuclease IV [Oscillospiraceae bacterium]
MRKTAVFGPGGNSESFYAKGYRSTTQAPRFLAELGLGAYEFEAGNGLTAGEKTLRAIGEEAKKYGIEMSLHTPYFISLSGVDPEKRLKSVGYIERSLEAAGWLGADTIVVHCGSAAKISREEAMALATDTLLKTIEAVGDTPVHIGLETMGKINQLGTLDEMLTLCALDEHFYPVVDFGHMNARERGGFFPDADSYRRIFDRVAARVGEEKARYMHCHFSKIEFTDAGEKRHLTFADMQYGPAFEPLAEAMARDDLRPRIICESAGTMAEDALFMQAAYLAAREES